MLVLTWITMCIYSASPITQHNIQITVENIRGHIQILLLYLSFALLSFCCKLYLGHTVHYTCITINCTGAFKLLVRKCWESENWFKGFLAYIESIYQKCYYRHSAYFRTWVELWPQLLQFLWPWNTLKVSKSKYVLNQHVLLYSYAKSFE